MTGIVASDRAPGLFVAPGVEIPDDAVLGANVVIYPGEGRRRAHVGVGASARFVRDVRDPELRGHHPPGG